MQDLNELDEQCKQRVLQFTASKSAILAHKCQILRSRIILNGLTIPNTQSVKDLVSQYLCSLNYHRKAIRKNANASWTNSPIDKTLHTA